LALGNGDIVRFAIESFGSSGVEYVNTLHYRVEGDASFAGNEPTVADACDAVWTKLGAAYRNCLYGDRTVRAVVGRTEVRTWLGEVASAGESAVGLTGLLAGGDGKVYRAQSLVIALKSDVASRSARGWIMVPGSVNSTDMDGSGQWSASGTYYTSCVALAALLDDNIQHDVLGTHAWHLQPVIYSRTRRKRDLTPYYFSVKSALAKRDPRWLRRRVTAP
jgi:hypothetical protein